MNIANWIDHWASSTPEKTALSYADKKISYAEFDKQVKLYAMILQTRHGVKQDDRVAVLGFNTPPFLYSLFAVARLGAIFVPLNWRLTPHELGDLIQDADPKLLLTDSDMADVATQAKHRSCAIFPLRLETTEAQGNIDTADTNCANGGDRPAVLLYTSGTTGKPKGALLSHAAILANAKNSQGMHELTPEDNSLISLPFFHVGGLNILTTPSFFVGATVTLHRKFDPRAMLDAMIHDGPTRVAIVSAQMPPILALPEWADALFPQIRTVTTGASPVPPEVFSSWRDKNVAVLQVYGATETCPIAICTSIGETSPDDASTGRAAASCQAKVVDDAGERVADLQRGEILIRGENLTTGYWKNESATSEAISDGWYSTGDIGYRDAAGFYYIVDRKKDLIISGGENIYPAEIELLLIEHKAIREAAVIAKPDDRWGEVPIAVIRLEGNMSFGHADTLNLLMGRLGRYKIPKETIAVKDFPRNSVGKIQKFALQKQLFRI